MSERKVLNKYYPPDFDPSKIPRLKLEKSRQYTVRIMAPCNMRCNTCHDYIARGKKFNARKETVEGEEYLGLKIFRFYFRCPVCMQEITYKTDPKSFDYVVESGATPNFKALKLAQQQAIEEQKAIEEEEKLNPVKMLENRTLASRREMENLEALEDLQEMNFRSVAISHEELLLAKKKEFDDQLRKQEEEDELLVQSFFGAKRKAPSNKLSTIPEGDDDDDDDGGDDTREEGGEGDEEIVEEIGSFHDLYPQLKAEIDISKGQDNSKKVTGLIADESSKPTSKLSKLVASGIIRKRPIDGDSNQSDSSKNKALKTDESSTASTQQTSGQSSNPKTVSAFGLLSAYSDSDDSD